LGIRCAFTPVVNEFDGSFLAPGQEPLQPGDRIVAVDGRGVENWSQLLRAVVRLGDKMGGATAVRVDYERPDADGGVGRGAVWCKPGRAPWSALVPSVLWLLLKVGLFAVGAIVLWKRPADRSAAQFFCLCLVSAVAFMGGYHWVRIATQPVLLV